MRTQNKTCNTGHHSEYRAEGYTTHIKKPKKPGTVNRRASHRWGPVQFLAPLYKNKYV